MRRLSLLAWAAAALALSHPATAQGPVAAPPTPAPETTARPPLQPRVTRDEVEQLRREIDQLRRLFRQVQETAAVLRAEVNELRQQLGTVTGGGRPSHPR